MKRYRITGSFERTTTYTYDCVIEAKDAEAARAIIMENPERHTEDEDADDDDYLLTVELDDGPQPEPEDWEPFFRSEPFPVGAASVPDGRQWLSDGVAVALVPADAMVPHGPARGDVTEGLGRLVARGPSGLANAHINPRHEALMRLAGADSVAAYQSGALTPTLVFYAGDDAVGAAAGYKNMDEYAVPLADAGWWPAHKTAGVGA